MTTTTVDVKKTPEPTAPATTDLWQELDRWFANLSDDWFGTIVPGRAAWARPGAPAGLPYLPALVDVEDRGTSFEVRTDLPGVPKEEIDVRVVGDVLQIRATSTSARSEEGKNYVRRERTYQGFQRVLELPEPVLGEKVEARYENGTLTVTVPKANPIQERKVPVA
jgi:HSP20 family molecular chaperone IbpA